MLIIILKRIDFAGKLDKSNIKKSYMDIFCIVFYEKDYAKYIL